MSQEATDNASIAELESLLNQLPPLDRQELLESFVALTRTVVRYLLGNDP